MHHMGWNQDSYYPELRHAALAEEIQRTERDRAERTRRRQRRRERWRSMIGRTDLTS